MFPFPLSHFAQAKGIPPSGEFIRSKAGTSNASTYFDTAVPIGAAYENRWIVVCMHTHISSGVTGTISCTIGGVAATKVIARDNTVGAAAMFIRNVPTGTTVDYILDQASGVFPVGGSALYVLRDLRDGIAEDAKTTNKTSSGAISATLSVSKGALVLGSVGERGPTAWAWSGATELWDATVHSSRLSGALGITDAVGSKTLTATPTGSLSTGSGDLLAASWR